MKLTNQMRSSVCLMPTVWPREHLAEIDLPVVEAPVLGNTRCIRHRLRLRGACSHCSPRARSGADRSRRVLRGSWSAWGADQAGQISGSAFPASLLCKLVHQPKGRWRPRLLAKVVQERLGHSTIAMTLDIYGSCFLARTTARNWRLPSVCFLANPIVLRLGGVIIVTEICWLGLNRTAYCRSSPDACSGAKSLPPSRVLMLAIGGRPRSC